MTLMKDSTTNLIARLDSGDEIGISPSGYTVTTGSAPVTGATWHGTTGTSIIYSPRTIAFTPTSEPEEHFEPPHCGKCRADVSIIESFTEKGVLTMIFICHGEKRRVDISLKKFKGNEADAKGYLLEQIDSLFNEEDDWRFLQPHKVNTENADRDAIRKWLTA